MKPNNPFVTLGYYGPEYFCDRVAETRRIVSAVENDSNLTLIAPRRYGKTGLIHNVFHRLGRSYTTVYLDIYATKDLAEFTAALASAVSGAGESTLEKATKSVARFFKSCRPTVTPQEDGMPKFSFEISPARAETSLREVFDYLKSRERKMVIAIDEFQQILEYPEKGVEALLRGLIQEVPWVRFIFAGSRHHLMGEMFLTAKHPFYNSTDILSLKVIDRDRYAEFAERFFRTDGQPFDRVVFNTAVYDRFDGITWYVQRLLKGLWAAHGGVTSTAQVDAVVADLVEDRTLTFTDLLQSQNEGAKKVLRAIAAEGCVAEPTCRAFLTKYALSASSVRSTIADLTARDILYRTEKGLMVYDRLFDCWLRR